MRISYLISKHIDQMKNDKGVGALLKSSFVVKLVSTTREVERVPRKPRFFLPGVPVHIVQRGHSREPVFFEDSDYQIYLNWLLAAVERYDCDIHAYVLITNHIHILSTPDETQGISRMMQYVAGIMFLISITLTVRVEPFGRGDLKHL